MNVKNFVSVKAAVREFIRLTGVEGEIDKADLLAWASDAADRIYTDKQLVHKISLLTVKDYKAQLPDDFRFVVQAGYRMLEPEDRYNREQISQITEKILGSDCELEINIRCPRCHQEDCSCSSPIVEVDADQLWRTSNPQYAAAGIKHFYSYGGNTGRENSCYYNPDFVLIKYTTSSYFGLHSHIKDCLNLNVESEIEYSINENTMNLNVRDGYVLLAYLGERVDEEGYMYIPNTPMVIKAISYYLAERWAYKKYFQTQEQSARIFWQQHVELVEKYIARAKSELQTPEYDEWSNFVRKFWHKVIPEYSYEENLYRGNDPRYKFKYPRQSYNVRGYDKLPVGHLHKRL